MITIGAFLSPLTPGVHAVRITGGYCGEALPSVGSGYLAEDFRYKVIVAA
jgi:hypothetical protein